LQHRTLPTPKSPADIDCVIEHFHQIYRRSPNTEELSTLEYIRQLLIDKQFASKEAAADN
jgi:hypothetical protein